MLKHFKSIAALLLCSFCWGGAVHAVTSETQGTRAVQQTGTCTGTVRDATGETIIGASVQVKGTTRGAITDLDGRFSIPNVQPGEVIIISYVGYQSIELKWDGTPLNITLKEDAAMLEEVVVVGYGTQKKVNVTGAVSMVTDEVFESRPVQNVAQALQGQIPGLTMSVGTSGGTLDSELNFTIRGNGTISGGSSGSPLVLIDGIEGNMNSVNPNDIASVSVLKDASSASIYGARAAFGVILITTKNGQAGKTRVSYTGNVRFSTAIQIPEMANSWEFANYYNVANANGGESPTFSEETLQNIKTYMSGGFTDPTTPEYYGTKVNPQNGRYYNYANAFANTDWFEEFYGKNVPAHEHNLSISGGSEKLTYMLSGNFLDQKGLLRHGKDKFNRYTLNAKISAKLADWITVNYTSKWTREDYERPTYLTGLFFHNIARRWPTCFVKDPNGHWAADMEIIQLEEGGVQHQQKNWNTNQLQVVIEPIKDWHINLEGSMRQYNYKYDWAVLPIYGYDASNEPYLLSWNGGAAGYSEVQDGRQGEDYFATNLYTDYSKTINGHYFKVLAGFNAELYRSNSLTGFGTNLITPTVPTLNNTQSDQSVGAGQSELAIAGFFGRINYNWNERYILEANLRYDGSSRFIGDKRWGLFPSFSAGWNMAREPFFEPLTPWIGTLKLRGSWGQLGNNELDTYYPFYQTMPTSVNSTSWLVNGQRLNAAGLPGIVNTLFTWETIESWDVGFDWGAFNNRFTGSFSYYNRWTKDMVAAAPPLPGILGVNSPNMNNADLKSYGWELEVSWRDRIKDFSYGVRSVLDDNQEVVTKYFNPTGSLNDYYEGRKIGEIWGYTTVGIAQSQEEMDAHLEHNRPNWGSGWTAGDIMYKDFDYGNKVPEPGQTEEEAGIGIVSSGSNTLDDHGDLRIIGNTTPRYKFGLTLDGQWKGIDFSVFFQGVMKRDYMLSGPYFWGASGGIWQSCCFTEHLDYWSEDNRDAYYPRPYMNTTKNQQTQTRYLQNAAYIRLKNLQVGYTLPKQWTSKAGIESLRVYFSADNVFTCSAISGVFDPETLGGDWGDGKLYPLQRTWSIGLNVNF